MVYKCYEFFKKTIQLYYQFLKNFFMNFFMLIKSNSFFILKCLGVVICITLTIYLFWFWLNNHYLPFIQDHTKQTTLIHPGFQPEGSANSFNNIDSIIEKTKRATKEISKQPEEAP